jgi:hypothetical protein
MKTDRKPNLVTLENPHRDIPTLDDIPRLRAGNFAAPEKRASLLGSAGLSAVGARDQPVRVSCESSAQGRSGIVPRV